LAASLHVAGLQDEQLNSASQPSLGEHESRWVSEIAKCAAALDSYWGTCAAKRIKPWIKPLESDLKTPPRFDNLKSIGQGGMGVVYSALDKQTNETVAIKAGKPFGGQAESIKREFRTLSQIRHPNLVVLKELHQFNGDVFFSMEYVVGEPFNSKTITQKNEGDRFVR